MIDTSPWTDTGNPRFIPPVVINCETGADYDTLLSLLHGWVVQVHLIDDDGFERIGTVDHRFFDDHIHLSNDGEGQDNFVIALEHVRWLQVL